MAPVAPRVRILSSGSEILQGLYSDTNATMISRRLLEAGFEVVGHAAAPDNPDRLRESLEFARQGCELIVMTGGLGPTADDLTRFVVAELWRCGLERDATAYEMMHKRFAQRGIPMPESNDVQTQLPAGCIPLYNHWGTAPGFILPGEPVLMALPGPPSECRPMLERALEKDMRSLFPTLPLRRVHTLHLALVPESLVADRLGGMIGIHGNGTEVTILASNRGHIRLRLVTSGATAEEAEATAAPLREEIVRRLGRRSFFAEGPEEASVAETTLKLLQARGETLALAESCTGGWIGKVLTDVPGSSQTLMAGYITYSNAAKMRDLGVPAAVLEKDGAVSEAAVLAMAEGARQRAGTDWGLSVSGVAGPDGGTEAKPVGTVWFGVASAAGSHARVRRFPGNRDAVRQWSVNQALELLRRSLTGGDLDALLVPDGDGS